MKHKTLEDMGFSNTTYANGDIEYSEPNGGYIIFTIEPRNITQWDICNVEFDDNELENAIQLKKKELGLLDETN